MANLGGLVRWQSVRGEPRMVGDVTITPESRVLMVRFPGRLNGGYVWNRPAAVIVERGGERERIPIVDVTRMAQISLMMSLVALAFITMVLSGRRKEQSE
jgi:hypothetical protein